MVSTDRFMGFWIYASNKPIPIISITFRTLAFMSFNFRLANGEVEVLLKLRFLKQTLWEDLRRSRNNERFTGSEVSLRKLLPAVHVRKSFDTLEQFSDGFKLKKVKMIKTS
jgi:hypothetical protein